MPAPAEMSRDELIVLVGEPGRADRGAGWADHGVGHSDRGSGLVEASEDLASRLARVEHLLSRNSSSAPSKDDEPGQAGAADGALRVRPGMSSN